MTHGVVNHETRNSTSTTAYVGPKCTGGRRPNHFQHFPLLSSRDSRKLMDVVMPPKPAKRMRKQSAWWWACASLTATNHIRCQRCQIEMEYNHSNAKRHFSTCYASEAPEEATPADCGAVLSLVATSGLSFRNPESIYFRRFTGPLPSPDTLIRRTVSAAHHYLKTLDPEDVVVGFDGWTSATHKGYVGIVMYMVRRGERTAGLGLGHLCRLWGRSPRLRRGRGRPETGPSQEEAGPEGGSPPAQAPWATVMSCPNLSQPPTAFCRRKNK